MNRKNQAGIVRHAAKESESARHHTFVKSGGVAAVSFTTEGHASATCSYCERQVIVLSGAYRAIGTACASGCG